jgi:RNA polymerase sigma factor (sigma-70 family)
MRAAIIRGMDKDLEAWFQREILPHEASLMRYLAREWRQGHDLQDVRHDIYVRVLETAMRQRPTHPRGLLFSIARNLLIDRIRRERVVSIELMEDVDALNVLVNEITPEREVSGSRRLQWLSEAFDRLPQRCREVVWMRRIEDLPQKEIARRLGIAESTVEKHLIRGIATLANELFGGDAKTTESRQSRAGTPASRLKK